MKREQNQARAIQALVTNSSVTKAAEAAGLSRRTIHEYLRDPNFVKDLDRAFQSVQLERFSDLEAPRKKAESVLEELLDDDSPQVRLQAAKVLLDHSRKREISMVELFIRFHKALDDDPLLMNY